MCKGRIKSSNPHELKMGAIFCFSVFVVHCNFLNCIFAMIAFLSLLLLPSSLNLCLIMVLFITFLLWFLGCLFCGVCFLVVSVPCPALLVGSWGFSNPVGIVNRWLFLLLINEMFTDVFSSQILCLTFCPRPWESMALGYFENFQNMLYNGEGRIGLSFFFSSMLKFSVLLSCMDC